MSAGGVLTLGETMAAFRSSGPWRLGGTATLSIAGSESNVAIGVSRLGHPARFAGVVGEDEFGALVLRTLRAEGVGTTAVRVEPTAPTGLIFFEQRLEGVVRVAYRRRESAGSRLSPGDAEAAFATRPDLLVVSGITPALGDAPRAALRRALELAAEASVPVVLDVNHRATLWDAAQAAPVLRELARQADVVVASEDELLLVDALLRGGRREVVVKRAGAGASVFGTEGAWHSEALAVRAVDTVGAGDAFVAGYCCGLLEKRPPGDRLALAVACGAFAVASRGDWEGLPRRDELALLSLPSGATQR